ncbi:saccharopine dehydrogenase C-terminal domain-containing protein, partial [Lysinibacillus sp. D4A3_S15]|uniref:saccharopine dehydrogenase C-terminal domain-containing protein n=1 Tax=Lysinibacillus sp. D4A3_S15 TaxID=2941227 RepID=UPI0024BE915B
YEFEMVVRKDVIINETAMARATANTISVVAQMIGAGVCKEHGVFPPESVVPGDTYIEEMAKRGLVIKETSRKSAMIV